MRKFVSLLLLVGSLAYGLAQPLAIDTSWFRTVRSAHHLTYWFDDNHGSTYDLPLSQTTAQIDVSFLPLGVHTIHCYAVDSSGGVYPTTSAMFFCPPAIGSVAMQSVVYWFDEDYDSRRTASLQNGPQLVDASGLAIGMHTIHCYVVSADSTVYPTTSTMFFCPPAIGSVAMQSVVYWFDEEYDNRRTASLQNGPQLIDASGLSIGMHTIHSYVVSADSTVYPTTSTMFFCPSATDSAAGQSVVFWFDEDYDSRSVVSQQAGICLVDPAGLSEGMHTIHSYVVGADNRAYPTTSTMFFHLPNLVLDSVEGQELVYWFDDDYENRVVSSSLSGIQMIDASGLDIGMHTIHSYVVGGNGIAYPTTSTMFFRPTAADSASVQGLVYWFDEDYDHRRTASSQSGIQMIDASGLAIGMHTVHGYVVDANGVVYPTASSMFFCPPAMDSSASQDLVYWFDEDYAHRQHSTLSSMEQGVDVSALSTGIHTFHSYMVGAGGTIYPTTSSLFFNAPSGDMGAGGIAEYYYWINGETENATRVQVSPVTNPLQMYGLIPMPSVPFRSSCFHFELDSVQAPHAYAKNTFHTLFYDVWGRFVMGEDQPFIDYHVSQAVVSDTIERDSTKTIPSPRDNAIHWFRLAANRGDSLIFKADRLCTMQLYSPSGEMVFQSSTSYAMAWNGCHAYEDGVYYLAVHDAEGTGNMTVSHKGIDRYAVLDYTPDRISNATSMVLVHLLGNGFNNLNSVALVSNDTVFSMDTILAHDNNEAYIQFIITQDVDTGIYDLRLTFVENDSVFDTLIVNQAITVEAAVMGEIVVGYDYVSTMSAPHIINLRVTNTGNISSLAMPIIIAYTNYDNVTLTFNNLAWDSTVVIDSLYHYANNLFGKGIQAKFIPLIIPHIGPYETLRFQIEFTSPVGVPFDFYAWAGKPWDHTRDINPMLFLSSSDDVLDKDYDMIINGSSKDWLCSMPDICGLLGPMSCSCAQTLGLISSLAGAHAAPVLKGRRYMNEWYREQTELLGGDEPYEENVRLQSPSDILRQVLENCAPENWQEIAALLSEAWDQIDGPDCPQGGGDSTPEDPPHDPDDSPVPPIHPRIPSPPVDPNEITGYLAESGSHYMTAEQQALPYRIECENDSLLAGSFVHKIVITDTLNTGLFDMSTYQLQRITIGNTMMLTSTNQNHIRTLDLRPTRNAIAQIVEEHDSTTGVLTWTITALDPMNLDSISDPNNGLLPPNRAGSGVASIEYTIRLRNYFPDNTSIPNRAYITFDNEAPIATPVWVNTIDAVPPTSRIAYGATGSDSISMSFAGSDNRSGVWRYELYGRQDSLDSWRTVAPNITHSVYSAPIDSSVTEYYVVAIDSAGNRENKTPQVEYNNTLGVVGPAVTTYLVRFANYDNTLLQTYHMPSGVMPAYLGSEPTRLADSQYSYRFRGWNPALQPVTGNTLYQAVYDSIPNRYCVRFYDHDSTLLYWDSIEYGSTPTYQGMIPTYATLDTFVYAFEGWSPALMPISGDVEYWPVFDSMPYNQLPLYAVSFLNWDDSVLQSDSISFGSMPRYWGLEPTRPESAGCSYRFRGWSPNVVPATDDVTYTAMFDTIVRRYTIAFVNFNGAVLQQDMVAYGEMPVYRGGVPSKRASLLYFYSFAGWSPSLDTVRDEAVYTATFDSVLRCSTQYSYENAASCGPLSWRGSLYGATGSYFHQVAGAANGCDSIYVLNLTVNSSSSSSESLVVCDSYPWHGNTYTASTTARDTLINAVGCDSVITLNLTVNHSSADILYVTTCDSYTWNDSTYTSSTSTPTMITQNAAGCDSVITLNLTVNHSSADILYATVCDSYTWNDSTYTSSTSTPTMITLNAAGCDSVITLNLTVNHSSTDILYVTTCDSYTWNDSTYTSSTSTPTMIELNAAGCDSVITLHLTVNYSSEATDIQSACDSLTWIDGITYATTTQGARFALVNEAGCDSIVTLDLTVNYSSETMETLTISNADLPFSYGGLTFGDYGCYDVLLQSASGCDSLIHLSLNHNSAIENSETISIKIYPNPTDGWVYIHSDSVQKVVVVDMLGRKVAQLESNQIDLTQMPAGNYYLYITTRDGLIVKKIVKR